MTYELPKHKSRKEIPEYNIWKGMRARCSIGCKSNQSYKNKNITVCNEWNDFICFYNDMGPRPSNNHSIDRIDNNKGYCRDNCRWTNQTVQCQNRGSFNKVYTYNGESKVLKQWAKDLNINYSMLHKRISYQGMSFEEAIKKRSRAKAYEINGRFESIGTWCAELNLSSSAVYTHMSRNKNKTFLEVLEHYNIKHEDIV